MIYIFGDIKISAIYCRKLHGVTERVVGWWGHRVLVTGKECSVYFSLDWKYVKNE